MIHTLNSIFTKAKHTWKSQHFSPAERNMEDSLAFEIMMLSDLSARQIVTLLPA